MRKKSIRWCGLCGSCGSPRFWCRSEFRVVFTFPVTFKVTLLQLLRLIKLVRIVSVSVRISISKCEDLNCSLCGSGSSTDVTISDRRTGVMRIWCADLLVTVRLWSCGFVFIYQMCVFVLSCSIMMSLSILMYFFDSV